MASSPTCTASFVTRTRSAASGDTSPMQNIREESEKKPSLIVEQSMLTMSPSRSTSSGEGMPWQTTSLTEVHTDFGKPS